MISTMIFAALLAQAPTPSEMAAAEVRRECLRDFGHFTDSNGRVEIMPQPPGHSEYSDAGMASPNRLTYPPTAIDYKLSDKLAEHDYYDSRSAHLPQVIEIKGVTKDLFYCCQIHKLTQISQVPERLTASNSREMCGK